MNSIKNNQWLDFCRAVAILLVLLSHSRGYLIPLWQPFNGLKFGGFIGVELFFALSGFLIGRIIIVKSRDSEGRALWILPFWFRRWARTYPIYILFLLLNIAISTSLRPAGDDNILGYFIFTQSLTHPHPSFFGEAWSLAVEEIFYFITPILYFLFFKCIKSHQKSLLLTLFVMILLPTIYRVYLSLAINLSLNEIRTVSLARLDSIMYGVLIAWLFYFKSNFKSVLLYSTLLFSLFFPALIYLTHLPDEILNEHNFTKTFLFNASGVICASCVVVGVKIKIKGFFVYIVQKIAASSYISYLINLPVLYTMQYLIPEQQGWVCILLWSAYLIITLSLAILLHITLEKKILSLRDKISPG